MVHGMPVIQMSTIGNQKEDEQTLVRLYMELTGTSEADARCVFMHVCTRDGDSQDSPGTVVISAASEKKNEQTRSHSVKLTILLFAFLIAGWQSLQAESLHTTTATNSFITQPLSLTDAINLALRQNPSIVRAQKDLEAAQGISIQIRAVAVPKVVANGDYNAAQKSDVDILNVQLPGVTNGFTFGNNQNWSSQIRLVQSIYEGGRILSSIRAARLTKEEALLNYQSDVANALLLVELAYYDVLLAEQQIAVQEASVALLQSILDDNNHRFEAGTVPRFNVLQAEVALSTARPKLIHARNSYRISKNNLAILLGFNIPRETLEDIPLNLSGKLEAIPYPMTLEQALEMSQQKRTELEALRKTEALRREDIIAARAGYKPSLQAFGGYDAHNSSLSQDLSYEDHGWIAGVQLNWNIFDGLATQGRIKEARAHYDKAHVDVDDTARRIELEVRTAYSDFVEADEVLKSQEKAVEEAEEALRLARARNEAGSGTQLDVLSAQNALTDSRNTQVQALHDYAAARAKLQRAVGANVPEYQ